MGVDSNPWQRDNVQVGDTDLAIIRGGHGNPILVLHEEMGYPGWLQWQTDLGEHRNLVIPMHPGFGVTERLDWMSSVRDLAGFYNRFLGEQGMFPIDVIGFSLGGWIAAEMAACFPHVFRRMVLVAPAGIRPPEGEIFDIYDKYPKAILAASVNDPENTPEFDRLFTDREKMEQFEAWEDARTQTARLAWEPYMYNPSLVPLLAGVSGISTMILWGRQDGIIPSGTAAAYHEAIENSKVALIDDCGHRPEIERRDIFVSLVSEFLNREEYPPQK